MNTDIEIPVSPDGLYQIYTLALGGKTKFLVPDFDRQTGRGFGDSIHDTLDDAITTARCHRQRIIDRQISAQRATEQKEREAAAKAEREDLDGFTDELPPRERGRIVSTLTKELNYQGTVLTRRNLIRRLVAEGRTVDVWAGERCLAAPDGRCLRENVLTKTGMDYAAFLAEKRKSEQLKGH